MSIFALSHPILLRCVGTSTLMKNPISSEVLSKGMRKILTTIISPKNTNRGLKHSKNKFVEALKNSAHLRFLFHKIYLTNLCMVINRSDKCTRQTWNARRSPDVTMNQVKGFGKCVRMNWVIVGSLFGKNIMFTLKNHFLFIDKQMWVQ